MPAITRIHKSLDKLAKNGLSFYLDVDADKWIIFSDHHRGTGDGADDFAPCKSNYTAALDYYYKQGYGLIILGDAEEFWENTLKSVITKYADVLEQEKRFHLDDRLIKIWGNHDDAWNQLNLVSHYLFPFFKNIVAHEAVNVILCQNEKVLGKMLLVHGHQGSGASDRFAGISRWFVRVIWRNVQRWFKIPLSTPSVSKSLKDSHDIAMHSWAKQLQKQIIVCGHTHQPVFMSRNHLDVLETKLAHLYHLKPNDSLAIAKVKDKIDELALKTTSIGTLVEDSKPCYFNTGCCSYADGDITGIELGNGVISLVKWSKEQRENIATETVVDIYKLL